jgi:hypothetical protein
VTDEEIKGEIAAFNKERDEALLSMDEQKIRAMVRKFNGIEMSQHNLVFWGAVHKAITGERSLPLEFRRKSKVWLDKNGLKSFDDGEL